jgi:hypothetical protein
MFELDITRKLKSDNLKGIIRVGDVELYANVDAGSILEAMAYMDEVQDAVKSLEKNPENPIAKKKAEKSGMLIYKAIRLIYDDEEYRKIKAMNLTMQDLGILVESAFNLFNSREEREKTRKN